MLNNSKFIKFVSHLLKWNTTTHRLGILFEKTQSHQLSGCGFQFNFLKNFFKRLIYNKYHEGAIEGWFI